MASLVEVNNPIMKSQQEIIRPVANFSPSLWGDLFSSLDYDQVPESCGKEIEVLKEEARSMLIFVGSKLSEKLILIDTIERLGLSYHFVKEIQDQLALTCNGHFKLENEEKNDLFIIALQFRLLRQHGFDVSSSIFERFTENNGEFKKTLANDIKGLLSLHEATYLREQGDEIMEKAFSFTAANLESIAPNLSESPLIKKQVLHALEQSLHRGIPRVEARRFISLYEEDESKNESLLRLAKLDFNLLQMLHRKELYQVTRWWKELGLVSKLSYARDRIVECYFWTLGVYFEPQYSSARIMLAKTIALISVIDDTYDAYGTIEELTVFTEAVQKWDMREIDQLPDYMKICYRALLNLYEAYDEELAPKGRSFAVHHAKEAMKEIVMSYYIEAKWFIEGYLPPFDEYMRNAKITSTYYLLTATSFLGMDTATNEAFNWLFRKPKIVEANVTICRVVDDVATYEVEKSRGQISTGIDCYMKEHGVSTQVAIEYLNEVAENAWKDMNEGLKDSRVSMEIVMRVFNLARLIDVVYKHNEDGYTHPEKVLKPHIKALFVDSFKV